MEHSGLGDRARAVHEGQALEEERHGDVQDLGHEPQPGSGDAVAAAFVLLDLLETNPDDARNFMLAQAELNATTAQSLTNSDIDVCDHRCESGFGSYLSGQYMETNTNC